MYVVLATFMPASIFSISASLGSMAWKAGPGFLPLASGGGLVLHTPLSSWQSQLLN